MWAHPGKKLLFMGCEIGQATEWSHDASLNWNALDSKLHAGVQRVVARLNEIYTSEPALQYSDLQPDGFQWVVIDDENAVVAMLRGTPDMSSTVLAISNLTPVVRENYRVGVPVPGTWVELLNTDAEEFGGSGVGNVQLDSEPHPAHGKDQSIALRLPPLATLFLKLRG